MSANEYRKVKWALEQCVNALVSETAEAIEFNLFWQGKSETHSEDWWGWHHEMTAEHNKFTTIIEALYPGDIRKLNDMEQRLDEAVAFLNGDREGKTDA